MGGPDWGVGNILQKAGAMGYIAAIMKKIAIIFDHDGTLVDSIDGVVFCTNKVIEMAGFKAEPAEKIKHGMAYSTAERFAYHTGIADLSTLKRMSDDFYRIMNHEGLQYLKLYPGIKECLDALAGRGYALGMVTNNQGLLVRRAAAILGYACDFGVILGEEDVPATKPAPGGLLQACAGLGAHPQDCWYIGDGQPDHNAARAGGLKSGLVSWGAHPRSVLANLGPEKLFDAPEQIVDFFK